MCLGAKSGFAQRYGLNRRAQGVALLMLAVAAACNLSGARAEQKAVAAWPPRQFPLTFWCSPPDKFITTEQYRRIADAGFSIVMPPCEGAASVERNRTILDTARATGLKAIVADSRMPLSLSNNPNGKAALDAIVKDYRRSPALMGYFLTDEPGATGFDGLAEVVAYLKKIDPEHVAYINLLPNYASTNQQAKNSQLGTDTYEQYLDKYLQTVKPDVLSYDHYHFLKESDRPGFLGNLSSAQRATTGDGSQAATPFWQIVLSVEHGPYRALTENELRYEAMQTLVYGGKGLAYFTYWQPDDPSFVWKNAIMNRDGTPGALYEAVRKVNQDVRTLTRYLYGARVLATYQTGEAPAEGTPLGRDALVRLEGPGNLSVGLFRDLAGYVYVLFTNRDYKKEVATTAILSVQKYPVERLDMQTGKFVPVKNPRNADGEMTMNLSLAPAGATMVRWK
jgi:hypothetical protein